MGVLVWFWLGGCLVAPAEYRSLLEAAKDADGDGYLSSEWGGDDCDDLDPETHPLAEERCDDLDQDCDGRVDEAAIDQVDWYLDADDDGYGAGAAVPSCSPLERHVDRGGDCNDLDGQVRPGGVETCGGEDEDCDGLIDDDDPSLDLSTAQAWYPDADGDGFGDASSTPVSACDDPGGAYLLDQSDCDDTDRNINPLATEVCQDGVDNDCSGDAPECILRGRLDVDYADISFVELAGRMVSLDGDGDGRSEFMLVDTVEDDSRLLAFSSLTGDESEVRWEDATWNLSGSELGGWASLGAPGDLNADGFDELVVNADSDNAIHVFLGSSTGFSATPERSVYGAGERRVGRALPSVGDVGGTGTDALVAGTPALRSSGLDGAVFLWFSLPDDQSFVGDADLEIYDSGNWRFGDADTARGGDLNGDGVTDLTIGVPEDAIVFVHLGPLPSGARRAVEDADVGVTTGVVGGYFGVSSEFGDLDGDGYEDLLVGEPLSGQGSVHLFSGGSSWDSGGVSPSTSVSGSATYSELGSVLRVADVDGNGVQDVLVGSQSSGGYAGLFYGPLAARDSIEQADAQFGGVEGQNCFTFHAMLDLNDDNSADLLVGCPTDGKRTYAILGQGL